MSIAPDSYATLRSAAQYVRAFRGKTFVFKLGGEVLEDPKIRRAVCEQLAVLWSFSIKLVLVHGGGTGIDALCETLNLPVEKVAGRRVTTAQVLDAAKMVLAGSLWPRGRLAGTILTTLGRLFVACAFVFYAIEHFLFPRFVPGVPLGKMTPTWVPAPALLAYLVGATLLATGVGLMIRRNGRTAAAIAGTVLLLLTIFFYVPILILEIRSPLAVEGVNYVGDTFLFAATALLAGFGAD